MAGMFEKALTGFNHNVKHRGNVYHVQTEDSGISNPHIITHLFVGGNIIASKRTAYGNILKAERLPEIVRDLMEEQHKEMLRNLANGMYDNVESSAPRRLEPSPMPKAAVPSPAAGSRPAAPAAVPPSALRAAKDAAAEPLFGEDLISGRSLDEVILSYLASKGDQ
jgi:hypothetical protein